ncbi:MAG TPA: hypothetical protein VMH88_07725 [Gemmatimonadales bacterium]|nr:hypothetical protein [Gemmatimonadales bacterium]
MWFKHRAWIPVAWGLSLANLIFVWAAAGPNEPWHPTTHALLAVLFALGAQRLAQRNASLADADEDESSRELEAGRPDQAKIEGVEGRLSELEERLDFTERALVDVRKRAQQPPPKE